MKKVNSSLAALALALAVWAIASVQAEDNHEGDTGHILAGYLAVADGLYKDDLDAAQKAALFIDAHDADSTLSAPAKKLAEAANITGAREAFQKLSAKAIEMANHQEGEKYTVMNCSIVNGGKGDWLSSDRKVNHPYFGAKMPHCGGPKK